MTYAPFSGRGYTRGNTQVKPDIVAPGVDIVTTAVGGSYTGVTGTSFATPFVTGSAAIMMQYGIVQGNDPFLYGEKIRAYLQRGAQRSTSLVRYTSENEGRGGLYVAESIL